MNISKKKYDHFTSVANFYPNVRDTDYDPINYIIQNLERIDNLEIIDLGCGTGRYTKLLMNELGVHNEITGIDANLKMLKKFQERLSKDSTIQIKTICSSIEDLEVPRNQNYDVFLSFNAVHHFNLGVLFRKIDRMLKPRGRAFIYTRTPMQNRSSIWGKYFPKFTFYENRLLNPQKFEKILYKVQHLQLIEMRFFSYNRVATLDELIHKVQSHHYSTFSFYEPNELRKAIMKFKRQLEMQNQKLISWIDRNLMVQMMKV